MRVDYRSCPEGQEWIDRVRAAFTVERTDTGERSGESAAMTRIFFVDEEAGVMRHFLSDGQGRLFVREADEVLEIAWEEVRGPFRLAPRPGMEAEAERLRLEWDQAQGAGT